MNDGAANVTDGMVDPPQGGSRITVQAASMQEPSAPPAGHFSMKSRHVKSEEREHERYNSESTVGPARRTRLAPCKRIITHGQPITTLEVLL